MRWTTCHRIQIRRLTRNLSWQIWFSLVTRRITNRFTSRYLHLEKWTVGPGFRSSRCRIPTDHTSVCTRIPPKPTLTRMSIEENIMVLLAHEGQVKGVIPDWPESLDNWKANGFKEKKENPHT